MRSWPEMSLGRRVSRRAAPVRFWWMLATIRSTNGRMLCE
jgi:hypothetical protein